MSLILEALKKSERQRRLGEMPNLGTPVLAARPRRSLLPWLAGAIVLALAAGAWLRFAPGGGEAPVERVADATPQPAPAPADAAPPAPRTTAPAAPAPAPARPQVATAPAVPLPSPDDRPGSVAELPVSPLVGGPLKPPAGAATATAPTPPAATPRPARPATAPSASAQAPAKPAAAKPAPAAPASGAPGAAAAIAPRPAAPKPAAAKPTATKPAAKPSAAPALPLVWEMPYSVRKDLPPLALTMHVYSSVAAERFVVVDGERHVEGDDLADGVVLRQIRSDGIVLDFKGQRFLYPRDGR